VQNSITYLQSAKLGDTLVAETTEVFNHHRLPFCETRVTNQRGELLCIVTGSAYRKKDILPFEKLQ
jgi:acyl-CoA thioesterase